MSDCECLAKCLFFNDKMSNMPAMAGQFKRKYCKGDNDQCARYKVFKVLGRENVPPTLFPNQMNVAERFLNT